MTVGEAFGVGSAPGEVAIPRDLAQRPGQSVWGVHDEHGELASCLAAVRTGDTVAVWWMATARAARRRGYGGALLRGMLADADAAAGGARDSLLYATEPGEPLYRAVGYVVLERWQLWARPRWALGRI